MIANESLPTVFIYEMPARFNADVFREAYSHPDEWWHPKPGMELNGGFGSRLDDGLFGTFAYAHEYVLHQRLLRYPRRVLDPADADILWVPFYATLSAIAHRKDVRVLAENERAALRWLREHAPRFFAEPHRHFLALGKVASEFVGNMNALYGSRWLLFRELRNVNVLSIEANAGSQALCIFEPQLARHIATRTLAGFKARRQHEPMAPLSAEERELEARMARVLAQPEGAPVEACMVRTALSPAEASSARVWAVPYNSIYAYERPPRDLAVDELAQDEPSLPWERQAPRPLLAAFVGAERREALGLYVPQRVNAVASCRRWAESVSQAPVDTTTADAAEAPPSSSGSRWWWQIGAGGVVERQEPAAASAEGSLEDGSGLAAAARGTCVVEGRTERRIVRELYLRAVFCLQPPGDTATRSGIFDSIVSGCIPVLWNSTTLLQYELHLPNPAAISLSVPEEHQLDALPWLAQLLATDLPRILQMREEIRKLAPRCQYSVLGGRPAAIPVDQPWDALEHALVGIANRRGLRTLGGL